MEIHKDIPLKNFTTMRLGGAAEQMVEVYNEEELAEACQLAKKNNLAIFVIGDGSNLIARDEGFKGLVIRIRITGFTVIKDDQSSATIEIGAGENWDETVKRIVDLNLSGIEAMSGIPGTAGATIVQNSGAYGQEIVDSLLSVKAYDTTTSKMVNLSAKDCQLGYRSSIFRGDEMGRYIITSLTLQLSRSTMQPPFYNSLQKYLDDLGSQDYSPAAIRQAVLNIRKSKIPDPKQLANSGSFFKNAIAEKWQIDDIKRIDSNIPLFAMADGRYKIPAGYLIEAAGLKGKLFNGIRVYDKNAVILVNESAKSYQDLAKARYDISAAVYSLFRIELEQEPLEIG